MTHIYRRTKKIPRAAGRGPQIRDNSAHPIYHAVPTASEVQLGGELPPGSRLRLHQGRTGQSRVHPPGAGCARSDAVSFKTTWFDLSQSYVLPQVTSKEVADAWASNPMQFWQNQLQFAVWCATSGCGVSVKDHLLNETLPPLLRSIFIFHVYFQTRRILTEMKCALPTNDSWSAFSNGIDQHAFQDHLQRVRGGLHPGGGRKPHPW